eukprot:m.365344 g.365344  ORF g.365344 m.365344 type:complete len:58 (-) comp16656_c0_seq3:2202-2375(-)
MRPHCGALNCIASQDRSSNPHMSDFLHSCSSLSIDPSQSLVLFQTLITDTTCSQPTS